MNRTDTLSIDLCILKGTGEMHICLIGMANEQSSTFIKDDSKMHGDDRKSIGVFFFLFLESVSQKTAAIAAKLIAAVGSC